MVHPIADMIRQELEPGDRIKISFRSYNQTKTEMDSIRAYFHYAKEHYFVVYTDGAEVYNEEKQTYEFELQGDRLMIPHDNVLYIVGPK